jgi:hypothetical protein
MVKDLRTQAVELRLHRLPKLQATQWNLNHVQPFFPSLEQLFKTETLTAMSDYGLKLPEEIESVVDASHIKTTKGQVLEVHRKTTMILSPFKTMKGEYSSPGLPKPAETAKSYSDQMQSPHTAAYVGALASSVLSSSGCAHFPRVYGVYAAMASKHEINISDDYEDLCERKWFVDQIGKTFELRLRSEGGDAFTHTRGQRAAVQLGDEEIELDAEDIEAETVDEPEVEDMVEEYDLDSDSDFSEESELDDEDVYEIQSCDCSETSEEETDSLPSEGDEDFAWATFSEVPVVTTVMEKCTGTFYDLLKTTDDAQKHTAWVAQIVFALAYAQRNFGFIHNDLHGNNVMYVPTTEEFLYYRQHGVNYRVPTFGVLIKIIDFDRATFSVRLSGMKEPRFFMSSQFKPDEEAGGQYNLEPFYDSKHPRIPLNPSFDLARFVSSVFWEMFPEGPKQVTDHPLFEMFKQWTTLPNGSSVILRKKGDNHDRYHGFDLYKAITRYLKESAVPRKEISKFSQYVVAVSPLTNVLVISD